MFILTEVWHQKFALPTLRGNNLASEKNLLIKETRKKKHIINLHVMSGNQTFYTEFLHDCEIMPGLLFGLKSPQAFLNDWNFWKTKILS